MNTPLGSKEAMQQMIGAYGWFVVAAFAAMLFKETLHNFLQGLVIFCGKDIENDDIIYISGRQARVVRVGLRRTIFYMTDRKTKMVVPNEQLKHLTIAGFEEQEKKISDHKRIDKKSEGIF